MSFYAFAPATTATPSIKLTLSRGDSSWNSLSHSFDLTADGAWHRYSYDFIGADTSKDTGMLIFAIDARNSTASADAKIMSTTLSSDRLQERPGPSARKY